jgi:hypothetical protein
MLTALIILIILVIILVPQLVHIWWKSRTPKRSWVSPPTQPKTEVLLLVTYDLRTPSHNYNPFYEALMQQGTWWHYISSTWLIATTKTPQELYSAVVRHITTGDPLLVVAVKRPYWGFLPREAWDWVNNWIKP